MMPYLALSLLLFLNGVFRDNLAFLRIWSSWQKDATVLMFVADSEARATSSEWAALVSLENPLADFACTRPPMKWHGITAQATKPILQFTFMLTIVAIKIEEMHWTMTDMRSAIIDLTVEVSLMMRDVSDPTLFSGFSYQANSLRSVAARLILLVTGCF